MEFTKREKQRRERSKAKLSSAEASEPGRYIGDRRDLCLRHPTSAVSDDQQSSLSIQHISPPQLCGDLFGLVAAVYHLGPPLNRILIQQRAVA